MLELELASQIILVNTAEYIASTSALFHYTNVFQLLRSKLWVAGLQSSILKACVMLTACSFQVARCTKIINPGTDEAKYVINVKQIAKVSNIIHSPGKPLIKITSMLMPV